MYLHAYIYAHLYVTNLLCLSLKESSADLPSEYWQIQKLLKYLKVSMCTHIFLSISSPATEDLPLPFWALPFERFTKNIDCVIL